MEQTNIERERAAQLEKQNNAPIFSTGLRAMLEDYLNAGDIDQAKKMFSCHHSDAVKAIREYEPEEHKIMSRLDKRRKGNKADYETCKLPRAIQKVANMTGTHFMFGNNLNITIANKPEEAKQLEPYFEKYREFLDNLYFDEKMYEARQITGSETECAKVYRIYIDEDGNSEVICQLRSNGNGDILYPMFNQYGKMIAFAVEYYLRDNEFHSEQHFEVFTKKDIWHFIKRYGVSDSDWQLVYKQDNAFGKIPVIYYNHEVDWDGAQFRIERLEWVDSKRGDTNEYFGDPYLVVTADVVNNRLADAKEVGKVIVMDDQNGKFEFVAPPDCGDMIENEKEDLKASVDMDTLTPDWSYKSIMGLGTLSGEAMRRANLPGYVKRTKFSVKVYNELIKRELNLIKTILCNYVYLGESDIADGINRLKIKFDYTDPFLGGIEDNAQEIATLCEAGAMSVHAAVQSNRLITDKQAEEERIWEERERMAMIEAKAKTVASNSNNNENKEEE